MSDIDSGFYLVKSSTLSNEEFELNNQLVVYPNPADNYVNIKMKNQPIESIKIYNSLGKLVYVKEFKIKQTDFNLNLSKFSSGFYIMKK